ncbi:cyclic nucleotide-binding domain-containing protein [Sphingobium aromaticiconvertens]|uniref:cyclic nucleotide-binding domain-containing protein n=1 Tax=Sphingobium aromaticiconvertens TaxID=365341 RepID=UPI003018B90D
MLHKLGRRRRLRRGESIAWAGEESRGCANVLSGILKVSALTADGREQIVGLLYPSDFVTALRGQLRIHSDGVGRRGNLHLS